MPQVSLSHKAYQAIKHKIVSLELPPGAIIDENELREELNLGRTPIREALKRLSLEKLVTIMPRRGMFVTEIAFTDLQRLFEMRVVLESLAARLAAQRGKKSHWQRMQAALEDLPEDGDGDNEALIAIDELCHLIMYEAADNEFLEDTLTTMYALSLRLWYFSLSEIGTMHETIEEHKVILEALCVGDADEAEALVRAHIDAFQKEIESTMLRAPASL